MKKKLFSILALMCLIVTGAWADNPKVTYALSAGDTFTSGQTVDVKDGNDVVATITYGESGGEDFKAAKSDSQVSGFTAVTDGNGTNGDKTGGTFYTIVPKYDGTITVAVILNAGKKFYVLEDGTALTNYNGITVDEKYYGTYSFEVSKDKAYKFYCAGSKLGFYGFEYTYASSQPELQPAGDGVNYALSVGTNEHGTITFKNAAGEAITTAQQNDVVTVEITPATGWVVNQPSGQWIAAVAAARSAVPMLNGFELTNLLGADNSWSFTMERANAEVSVSYKKLLTNSDITIEDITALTYTGQAQEPVVTVKDGQTVLVKDVDYTVAYSNNIAAALSTATTAPTVTITAVSTSDKYAGTATKTFTINKKALEDDFIADITAIPYTGQALTPEPVVTYNNMTLVKGNDYTVSYANNTEVGTATVTVTAVANGNYSGSASKDFTIEQKALEAYFIAKIDDVTYTGKAHTPEPVVTYKGMTLKKGTDYIVGYSSNVNAGKASVILVGMGKYSGTASKSFNINKAPLTVKADNKTIAYGDEAPEYTVSYEGFVNNETKDVLGGELTMQCGYAKNVSAAGEYVIRPSGLKSNNYDISFVTGKLTVGKKALDSKLMTDIAALTYTGVAQTPAVTVKDGETVLVEGTDYTLAYANNTNAGTATVTITAVGTSKKYSGSASKNFTIKKAALTVKADDKTAIFGDEAPEYTVSYDGFVNNETATVLGGTLAIACPYVQNQSGVGEYTITPSGLTSDNYDITFVNGKLTVSNKAMADNLVIAVDAQTYTGQPLTPTVTVKDGETTLVEGTDYTVAFANNVNAGTATVTITCKGNYSGSKTAEFTINKAEVAMTAPEAVTGLVYNAQAQTLVAAGQAQGGEIQYSLNGETYATALPTGTDAKEYTVYYKVVADANHIGVEAKSFKVTIAQAALTAATLVETNLVFNQQEQTAEVASVTAGTLVVTEDSYEVSGNKATNVGTYTVTVTGKGNFKGTATAQFSIVADNANTFALTLNPTEFVYDGQEKKPAVTVKDGETVLVENTDYTLAYANNVNAGTATVTATGKGNYSGTKTAEFTIKKAEVVMTAPEAVTGLVYNGEAQTLITAGSAEGGEMQYSLDNENFSTTLPTGTDAKEYTVYYKVVADANHNDVEAQSFKVTIATNKTALNAAISSAETYYNSIKDEFADVAATLLAAINAAKEVKDNADATQTKIETATTTLNAAVSAAEQAIAEQIGANQAAADAVIAKINAIGTVEYTETSKALIDAARVAYDALTDVQKALVSAETLKVLTDAEAAYAALKAAAEQAAADQAAADAAIAKINAIGTVEYTDASKALIDAAREAYDALTDVQKALVSAETLKVLTDAEAAYAALKAAAEKVAAVREALKAIIAVDKTIATEGMQGAEAFATAITAAEAATDAADATVESIAAARTALAKAVATFTKANINDEFVEITQDQGKTLDDFTRTELVEGEDYNTYTAAGDLNIAIKMMNLDVKNCDYVVVKFAEPVAAGWHLAFWSGQDLTDVTAGATEFKYVFADDPKCGVSAEGVLPQICMMTFFGGFQAPLEAKIVGIYKHYSSEYLTGINAVQTMSNGQWYDMNGRKLDAKPTKKGVYILNGKKVAIK